MAAWAEEVYRWYFGFTCEHGYQPSFLEAETELGLHRARFTAALNLADRCGWARVDPGLPFRKLTFLVTPDGQPFAGFTAREAT